MPTYLTPGVYVEEVPSTNKPIEGVGTSVAAFVGLAPGGPINKPMRIANWSQFVKTYSDPKRPMDGPFLENAYLGHAVYGFFLNGGKLCWVVRVGHDVDGAVPVATLPAATDASLTTFRAEALPSVNGEIEIELSESPGAKDNEKSYKLVISAGPEREEFDALSLKKGRNYLVTKVNAASKLIKVVETGAALPESQRIPATGRYRLAPPATSTETLEPMHFEGDVASRKGMGGLAAVDEITMVCVPDAMTLARNGNGNGDGLAAIKQLQTRMIAHCESAADRLAILDAPPDLMPQDILEWRTHAAGYDSKFATLYYPWIEVGDPVTNKPIMVPPSGHMAGVWCRTDATRGVHKAPANEVLRGVTGLGFQVTHEEQGELNRLGINCIRTFPARGIRVWGARTLSSDPEWRYINVRRLFNYIAESITVGTQWSVFEPNDRTLWLRLRVAIKSFLTRVWESGALFGSSIDEAFYVKCDDETNPPEVIEAGQVVCEIGIAPVKPAEFVVFRLSQFASGGRAQIEA